MTVTAALRTAEATLKKRPHIEAVLDTEILLAFVLGQDRVWLLTHQFDHLPETAWRRYQALVRRRSHGIPVAYLTQEKEFFGLTFVVTPATLIPRPETEQLVETALKYIPSHANVLAADVGTGNGCIAVSLAQHRPRLRLIAADRSPTALVVARRNARRHHVANRITFRHGDLLTAIPPTQPIFLLLANLPYLKRHTGALTRVRHEPRLALDGGSDGLAVYRRLFQQLARRPNRPDGIICEIGPGLVSGFRSLTKSIGYRLTVEKDLAQRPRVAILQRLH